MTLISLETNQLIRETHNFGLKLYERFDYRLHCIIFGNGNHYKINCIKDGKWFSYDGLAHRSQYCISTSIITNDSFKPIHFVMVRKGDLTITYPDTQELKQNNGLSFLYSLHKKRMIDIDRECNDIQNQCDDLDKTKVYIHTSKVVTDEENRSTTFEITSHAEPNGKKPSYSDNPKKSDTFEHYGFTSDKFYCRHTCVRCQICCKSENNIIDHERR